jgi:hypothetical protein
MIVDSSARGKPLFGSGDQGFNIVKFLLSILSIVFDIIFMFQHYVLYRDKWEQEEKVEERQQKLAILENAMKNMNEPGQDGRRFLGSEKEAENQVNFSKDRLLNKPDE